jgi:predicted Zn-dependent protease
MNDLEPHDWMHLNAADGWLDFDNCIEADKELKQITPAMQRHPEVLARRFNMLAKAECWHNAEQIAEEIIEVEPDSTFGWVHRSDALRRQDLTGTARMNLLPALATFPEDISIRYSLACYECLLGNVSQAKSHLQDAFNLAQNQKCTDEWKARMLADEDLKPLWDMWDTVEI